MIWFHMRGPGGAIAIKATFAYEAKAEASERWSCDPEEISITGTEPYHGSGDGIKQ